MKWKKLPLKNDTLAIVAKNNPEPCIMSVEEHNLFEFLPICGIYLAIAHFLTLKFIGTIHSLGGYIDTWPVANQKK